MEYTPPSHNGDMDTIVAENARRRRCLRQKHEFDPVAGLGSSGPRTGVTDPQTGRTAAVPCAMTTDPDYTPSLSVEAWQRLRCRHDFEYWAATCAVIRDKITGRDRPFILNPPQRRVAAMLEEQRRAGKPLRLIMLKARQWGGSTLVQMYMAWIQTCHRTNWHSLICAHVKDTSSTIRAMYTKLLASYPEQLWTGDEPPRFSPFERSQNTRVITGRGCRVTLGSSENPEAVRGADYAMAHLSEVAFWSDTRTRSPEDLVRAVSGAIVRQPLTLVVMESTANGVGNYFHTEWLRANSPEGSDKQPVFVPWHEIPIYSEPVADNEVGHLWHSFDDYELALWKQGLTLEQIKWYHNKRREYPAHQLMMAEYPGSDVEAFANTGHGVFSMARLESLRTGCSAAIFRGELTGRAPHGIGALHDIRAVSDPRGCLEVWRWPETAPQIRDRYVVAVDIGGRSASSDWSVIAVIDRGPMLSGGRPEVVAQWRGHIDHDLLAWKSAALATWYCEALLVIESNTLDTEASDACDGGSGDCLLTRLGRVYANMYRRTAPDSASGMPGSRIGFHTNRSTKALVISELIAAVRDGAYVERSHVAIDEMAMYQLRSNGVYEAARGHHDDVLMTRAIALYVTAMDPPLPASDITPLLSRVRQSGMRS